MTDDINDLDAFAHEPMSLDAPKKSLAISPNLEALLAHDERTRASVPKLSDLSDPHSHFTLSSFSGSMEPTFANSLPPPPRGNRRGTSRSITPMDANRSTSLHRPRTLSGTLPNPYLNEIPKLPRLDPPVGKKGDASGESLTLRSPPTTVTSPTTATSPTQAQMIDGILETFCGDPPRRPSLPTSPNSDLRHSISSVERRNSVGTRPYTTLPRVDRFLGKGKSIFSRHGDREEIESSVTEHGALLNPSVSAERHVNGGANDEKKHQRSATTGLSGDKHITSLLGSPSISPRPSLEYKSGVKRPVPPHASRSWHPSMSPQPKLTRPSTLPRADATDPIDWSALAKSPERLRSLLDSTNSLPYISASSQLVAPDSLSLPSTSPRFSTAPEASSASSYATLLSATITPKPALYRQLSGSPLSPKRKASPTPMSRLARQSSPKPAVEAVDATVPPTTNFLNAQARADLVKKSRKLAKVFGATPGALAVANQDDFHITSFPPIIALPKRHRRGAASVSNITTPTDESGNFSPWAIVDTHMSAGRRHSTPDDMSFLNIDDISPTSGGRDDHGPESPIRFRPSFMSLSDDDMPTPSPSPREDEAAPGSPTSIAPTITEQDDEDADRRRKRERLAKLHRFLGSHVPAELVFGIRLNDEASLPSPASPLGVVPEDDSRKAWTLRRRSSSVLPLEDTERRKEELNTEEKALKVRRALKMEKVFGVPPPRTLYSRETTSSPSSPRSSSQPPSPAVLKNPNQSAYKGKTHRRILTSDSTTRLIPSPSSGSSGLASVYSHYQHSITTLNNIIERDDRASLAELHQYLQGGETVASPDDVALFVDLGSPTSLKSDRRLSLPSSILSVSTADSSTRPEANDFQLRRRRAAKLTQFFGVDYKSVMQEVLESIEKGVEDERQSGTLQPDEAEALFQKLRLLKKKKLTATADL